MTIALNVYVETPRQRELLPGGQRTARRRGVDISRPRICLVNGNHTPGSEWEHECPLRNFDKRSERSRQNALAGWTRRRGSLVRPNAPGER